MKSLTWLAVRMLTDVHMQCATTPLRDIITMKRRIEHEGLSFLTITLPAFERDFVRSLSDSTVAPDRFTGFHVRKGQSLPAFLQGLTELVFDTRTGCIHTNPSITAISAIRQFCLFFKKVEIDCTPERVNASIRRFEECDAEIVASRTLGDRICDLEGTARVLASAVFAPREGDDDRPRHGPGATAERVNGNAKYSVKSWWRNLDLTHPVDEFLFTSCEHMLDEEWGLGSVVCAEKQSPPVRVVTVPKTQTTPRVIAIEPVTMQYAQQQASVFMVKAMESHSLTRGVINFTNQEKNREKAITSSRSGVFATLDLSEASDRVSASLVSRCLRSTPDLRRRVFGSRSATASLPGLVPHRAIARQGTRHDRCDSVHTYGRLSHRHTESTSEDLGPVRRSGLGTPRGIPDSKDSGSPGRANCGKSGNTVPERITIRLRKFAAMGSALCFPVEAFMFYVICMNAILRRRNLSPTQKNLRKCKGLLYVYGDDIICHRDEVATVIEDLEYFGLEVNAAKSFWTGKFRESCGMDAYDGECVTPTYLRRLPPLDRQSKTELISWISTANLLYKAGYWMTARAMRKHVEQILGTLPHVLETSPVLGWHSFLGCQTVERWNIELHRFEVHGYVPSPLKRSDKLDGYPALLKCLVVPSSLREDDHLDKTVRSGTVTLKRRWKTAH